MSLFNEFMKNLNESAEVKKTYGDVPQEGKTEKLTKGKKVSIPKSKTTPKYKITKLKSVNKQAVDAYPNDTEKVMDQIGDKKHSDKGKIAKVNSKKADRKIKLPYGDKVQPSDSKLVKESEEVKECDKTLKEYGNLDENLLKKIYYQYVDLNMEDEFFDDCLNKMNISEDELQEWYNMGEEDYTEGCHLKEGNKNVGDINNYKNEFDVLYKYIKEALKRLNAEITYESNGIKNNTGITFNYKLNGNDYGIDISYNAIDDELCIESDLISPKCVKPSNYNELEASIDEALNKQK